MIDEGPAMLLAHEIAAADVGGDLLRLLTAARRMQGVGLLERAANLVVNVCDRETKVRA
jgi:hypothetical protein